MTPSPHGLVFCRRSLDAAYGTPHGSHWKNVTIPASGSAIGTLAELAAHA